MEQTSQNTHIVDEIACIKLKGLPFETTRDDILSFLHDVPIKDVFLKLKPSGKFSGEAYTLLEGRHILCALAHNRKMLGKRFIEVMMSSLDELKGSSGTTSVNDGTLRLVGLPFDVTKQTILEFFEGLEILPDGIGILTDGGGRPTGEAFVQFVTQDVAKKARMKHMQNIGRRYIEIYESSLTQANYTIRHQMYTNMGILNKQSEQNMYTWVNPLIAQSGTSYQSAISTNQPLGYSCSGCIPQTYHMSHQNVVTSNSHLCVPSIHSRSSNAKCTVQMRGLPYAATELDVIAFFHPIQPLTIRFRLDKEGKHNGEAIVRFANVTDTEAAMSKNGSKIGSRYIELFSKFRKRSANCSS